LIFELSFIDNHLIELIYKLIILNNYTINAFKNSSFNFYSLIYKNIDKALSLSSFNTIIYFLKYFASENGNNYSHQKIEEL